MNYQVLARKWRPKKFQDVIGQRHITRSLQNAVTNSKFGHAYILTGTRGIGKTSLARIFAKAIRCENQISDGNPCGECPSCQDFETGTSMNVIEIDGASNNSVENVRDLIGDVQYLPTTGSYKVYIIDEVHMLSTSAFNALLKTLEEPPSHVLFILATTEPQKLLGTVLSRCQRFDFRIATIPDLTLLIKKISKEEGIHFDHDELIESLCEQGKGSVRDTLSLLDQVLSFAENKKIDENILSISLGLARTSVVSDLVCAILMGHVQEASKLFRELINENVPVKNIVTSLMDNLYKLINWEMDGRTTALDEKVDRSLRGVSAPELYWIYESLVKDSSWGLDSIDPSKVVEIILQKIASRRTFFNQKIINEESVAPSKVEETAKPPVETKEVQEVEETQKIEAVELNEPEKNELVKEISLEPEIDMGYSPIDSFGEEQPFDDGPIEEEPLIEEPKKEDSIIEKPEEVFLNSKDKTWENFLDFLRDKSPASASNIEQGNTLGEISIKEDRVIVEYGFTSSSKVFLDYIQEKDVYSKLVGFMSEYFSVDKDNIELRLTLVDEVRQKESNFLSKAEMKKEKENNFIEEKRQGFLNDPIIKEAEQLFNTKVDKVIMNNNV